MNWIKKIALVLAGLVVLAVLGLLAAGQRADANRLDVSVEIGRPAAEIWPWLIEPAKLTQWVSWLKRVRQISPGADGVGAREQWVMEDRNNGNAEMLIESVSTVYEPHRRLAARLSSQEAFTGDFRYELADAGGKTTVRALGVYQYQHWLAKLLEPLITPEARKKLVGDLAALKRLVETTSPSSSSSSPAPGPSKPSR